MSTSANQPMIESMESRQMFSFTLPDLDEYVPSQVLDIITRYTPLGGFIGGYNGVASIVNAANSGETADANKATIRILKQTAGGLVRGRLSVPGSNLKSIPFVGRLDKEGILKSDIKQEGLAGRVIGKFVGKRFTGKFNVTDAIQKLTGMLKLKKT